MYVTSASAAKLYITWCYWRKLDANFKTCDALVPCPEPWDLSTVGLRAAIVGLMSDSSMIHVRYGIISCTSLEIFMCINRQRKTLPTTFRCRLRNQDCLSYVLRYNILNCSEVTDVWIMPSWDCCFENVHL